MQWKRKTRFVIETLVYTEKAIFIANKKLMKNSWIFWIQKQKLHQKYQHIIQTLTTKRERKGKIIVLQAFNQMKNISLSVSANANATNLAKSFSQWKSKTILSLEHKYIRKLQPGKEIHTRNILRKALNAFLSNAKESKLEKKLNQAVIQFKLKNEFHKWTKITELKRSRRLNESAAILYCQLTILNESWTKWKQAQDLTIIKEKLVITVWIQICI